MELWEFMRDNLPFAFYGNTNNEYSDQEFHIAQVSLEPVQSNISSVDKKLLLQSFACLVRHIKYVKNDFDRTWTSESMKDKGIGWSVYHKMIFKFNTVMQSFTYNFEGKIERWGETFQIQKVIFKGAKKGHEITLEGPILEILRAMFSSFNKVYTEGDKERMKAFSFRLYEAYIKFTMEWLILNGEPDTHAKNVVKNREETKKETAFNRYRNQTAFYIHKFLKKNNPSKVKIPEWHKKLIGDLFIACEIAHDDNEATPGFVGTSYNSVRRWIEEGEKSLK